MTRQEKDGRRAKGTLTPRYDKSGKVISYQGSVTVGYHADGRQRRKAVSAPTHKEALAALNKLKHQADQGMVSMGEAMTVGQYLDTWVQFKARDPKKSPNTIRTYADAVRLRLKPQLGRKPLDKLCPLDVQRALDRLADEGKSPAALSSTLRILKMALKQAVKWERVPRNVAQAIEGPTVEKPEMQVWTGEQVGRFVTAAQGHRLEAALILAAATGLRRGEVLGLTWGDLDPAKGTLTVRQQVKEVRVEAQEGKRHAGKDTVCSVVAVLGPTKTRGSRRTIHLHPSTVKVLEAHRERQEEERAKAGARWQDQGLIFASPTGGLTLPHYLYDVFQTVLRKAELPRIRFHDLRHTAASLLFKQGIAPKIVSSHLGHSNVSFTLNTYTHLYEEQMQSAVLNLADLYPKALGAN